MCIKLTISLKVFFPFTYNSSSWPRFHSRSIFKPMTVWFTGVFHFQRATGKPNEAHVTQNHFLENGFKNICLLVSSYCFSAGEGRYSMNLLSYLCWHFMEQDGVVKLKGIIFPHLDMYQRKTNKNTSYIGEVQDLPWFTWLQLACSGSEMNRAHLR